MPSKTTSVQLPPASAGLMAAVVDDAVARAKPFKLFDRGGLFLLVTPHGAKYWRQKFRLHGKERQCSLGVYPEVSLSEARAARDRVRAQVAVGLDPVEARRQSREGSAPPDFLLAWSADGLSLTISNDGQQMILSGQRVAALRAFLDARGN